MKYRQEWKQRITPEVRVKMESLAKQGYTYGEIAQHLGINENTISSEFARGGGKQFYNAEERNKSAPKDVHRGLPFSRDERELIEKYLKMNFSNSQIAKILKRSKNGVNVEIRRNGGREKYNAELAEKHAGESKENFGKTQREFVRMSLARFSDTFNNFEELEKRVRSLEFQVEILVETIKESRERK